MCELDDFLHQTENNQLYFPAAYPKDGFIHATKDPLLLLTIANHFYKNCKGILLF